MKLTVPAPVQEQQPVAWACLFTDDGSLCQTFDTQKEADKWVESDDNLWDVYVAPLYTVQPRKADGCNWPICQTEQYQQDLADQIAKELIGEPRKAVKLTREDHDAIRIKAEQRMSDPNLGWGTALIVETEVAVWAKLGVTE